MVNDTDVTLNLRAAGEGDELRLLFSAEQDGEDQDVLAIRRAAIIEEWSPDADDGVIRHRATYEAVQAGPDGDLVGTARVTLRAGGVAELTDTWSRAGVDTWRVDRVLRLRGESLPGGVRLRFAADTALQGGAPYDDVKIFAPSAMYDKNDLDRDGVDDYLPSKRLSYRDDRLNSLSVMAYHPSSRFGLTLLRADLPAFDPIPEREKGEYLFLQHTDIGSLGVAPDDSGTQTELSAAYPFDEGEFTHALLLVERPSWGAMWPTAAAPELTVSYMLRAEMSEDFHEALWKNFSRRLADLSSQPVELHASLEEITRYRAESLNTYFRATPSEVDRNEPAGYVLNCHPQIGTQIADIIQYGFTGQNTLNAWCMMRFGEEEWHANAVRAIDFFVDVCHLSDTGMFYDLYNNVKGKPDSWWTGLLLPLAYAEPGGSLEELMGPIYLKWEDVIPQLMKIDGSYLRCMSESAYGILLAYELERDNGRDHPTWLDAAVRYGDFLVGAQEDDGSWYRAYDHSGQKLTEPEIWFGTTAYEQKSSSGTPIQTLVKLTELTGDQRYLDAAVRAGDFVRTVLVGEVKFNGGIHDPIYAKGQLVDNEGILYPMLGLHALHRALGEERFLDGAIKAARLFASWTWLWDVPLPETSTLAKHGFRSTGIGACDTSAIGYVHPFELLGVPELIELGQAAHDPAMIDVAELLLQGCNQTVAVPGHDWGYASTGLQEEGYLISWWLGDDPIFDDTAFGNRWKGEGNKTCYPWIPAVAMACHWKLVDRFGTTDLASIRSQATADA